MRDSACEYLIWFKSTLYYSMNEELKLDSVPFIRWARNMKIGRQMRLRKRSL